MKDLGSIEQLVAQGSERTFRVATVARSGGPELVEDG